MAKTITFEEWRRRSINADLRARAVSESIRDRARDIAAAQVGTGRDYAFLCCHNWSIGTFHGKPILNPAQLRAARLVLHLEEESWKPIQKARDYSKKLWERVVF